VRMGVMGCQVQRTVSHIDIIIGWDCKKLRCV
jgi:hypothetical protein